MWWFLVMKLLGEEMEPSCEVQVRKQTSGILHFRSHYDLRPLIKRVFHQSMNYLSSHSFLISVNLLPLPQILNYPVNRQLHDVTAP